MTKKTTDAISRSDRVLVAALAIILATASAAIGASMTYRPHADKPVAVVQMAAPVPAAALMPAADTVMGQLLAEHKCLTEVLYYEARGEGTSGQKAIAEVIFHRMNHGNYGQSICAVVYEGKNRPGCQFSFACNGDMKRPKHPAAWHRAESLAARILTGEIPLRNTTGGATNFHAISVSPIWADTLQKTTQIGSHIFYRGPSRTRKS
jgi:spore germination cell wall hydrolase CwlJ-like protein